jgi:hypothetical protein
VRDARKVAFAPAVGDQKVLCVTHAIPHPQSTAEVGRCLV